MNKLTLLIIILLVFPSILYSQQLFKVKEDLVIGKDLRREEFQLSWVSDVKVDDDGNIYVLDRRHCRLFKFNPYGALITTIGKRGDGFGEFEDPLQMVINKEGKIFVRDKKLKRITVFSADGTYHDLIKYTHLDVVDFYPHGRDKILFVYREEQQLKIGVFNDRSELLKEIIQLPVYKTFTIGVNDYKVPDYFSGRPYWAFSPSGEILAGSTENYKIDIYDTDGKLKKSIERAYTPGKITEKEVEWYIKRYKIRGKERDSIILPEFKTPFDRVYVTRPGENWVRTMKNISEPQKVYDIFNNEGKFISEINIRGTIRDFWKDFVFVTDQSRYGLPIVVKYKIEKKETLE